MCTANSTLRTLTLLALTSLSAITLSLPLQAQTWGNSAPRAGSAPVYREPLDPEPAPDRPAYGGYGDRRALDDSYRAPRPVDRYNDVSSYRQPPPPPGYGERYAPPGREDGYDRNRRHETYEDEEPQRRDGTYSVREITDAGHGFFGSVSRGLASVIEYAFKKQGRPNGYILGEDLGGAFVAGLRYGEGTLHTRDAGRHKVYWQGPSIGYDAGAEGSKVMVLVYNLRDPSEIYQRFGGVAGSAYVVGGVGINFQVNDHVALAPIRSGIGLRIGANIGYLKYTRRPTWNPF